MKRSKRMIKKLLVFMVMAVAMVSVGVSYAAWNSDLNITANLTTGIMDILFKNDPLARVYTASITDCKGDKILQELEVKCELERQGKLAKVVFLDALPLEKLQQGKLIRLDLPLQAGEDSTLNLIQNVELDRSKPGEKISLGVERAILAIDGKAFGGGLVPNEFKIPLEFEIYRTANQEEQDMVMQVYMKMVTKPCESTLPRSLIIREDLSGHELQDEISTKFASDAQNGIIVVYSVEIPLYIGQVHSGEMKG